MEITVMYGSETGNSENLAQQAQKKLTQEGFSVKVLDMSDVTPEKLLGLKNVILITSTWGDGDPPANAEVLYEELKNSSGKTLSGVSYSVFALGQSFYEHFCKIGKDFDQYLEKNGAKRVLPVECSDDNFDELFPKWMEKYLSVVAAKK